MAARNHTPERALSDWDRLRVVLALRRGGTFSAAARALGVDHTTMARRLEGFERDLGAPLFERGPAGFAPTPLGEEVLAAAERMEGEVTGLLRRLDGAAGGLTGVVRLTTTPHLAAALFAPALGGFLRDHPGLRMELVGDARSLDLSRREADLAVRLSRPEALGLVARRLGEVAFALYAAAGDPRPFEAIPVLAYEDSSGSALLQRYLASLVPPERMVLRTNTMAALHEAARAGLGAAVLSCLVAEADPALRRVPAPRAMPAMPLWLLYHEDLRRSPRVRAAVAFVDAVIAERRAALAPPGFPFDPV
ncbi:LysR family transcriptional regulator [Muricoccus radiodurans]|uniref:LysR family transcriptional regulator n=1 Tax=Muricoccus radiodurans TaxID=2231721 RepID=UPI003CF3F3A5